LAQYDYQSIDSGQYFDSDAQQYYLRARWYNPSNGLFNRIDPYSGDTEDPQSLHKYLYCYGNPINGLDPTGEFSIAEVVSVQGITKLVRQLHLGQIYAVYDRADTAITAINLYNQWQASGRVDVLSLSLLAVSILPIGKILSKVKIEAKRLIGASDDLTKLFRSAGKRTNKIVQSIGELGAELTAKAKKFKVAQYIPEYHGFDQVYKKGRRFIIVEAKGGTGKLAKGQMSARWIKEHIVKLANSHDAINKTLGEELWRAWKNDAVDAMVVTTKIIGDEVQDPEFVFKAFHEIGKETF
jgi:RHS repeat-associated protein